MPYGHKYMIVKTIRCQSLSFVLWSTPSPLVPDGSSYHDEWPILTGSGFSAQLKHVLGCHLQRGGISLCTWCSIGETSGIRGPKCPYSWAWCAYSWSWARPHHLRAPLTPEYYFGGPAHWQPSDIPSLFLWTWLWSFSKAQARGWWRKYSPGYLSASAEFSQVGGWDHRKDESLPFC